MLTSRRGLIGRLAALAAGGAAAWRVSASPASADDSGVPKVAYHLADTEKVQFVLGNIANHIEGMGGPDKVHIVLVVHGPALLQFRKAKATPDLEQRFSKVAPHIGLAACGNTMKAQDLTIDDLLPGFVRVDEGGVVRLAKLQAEGYAYLRP